jgi:hypothetical protein
MDLDGPLRAQSAVKVERPPTLWEADTETEPFLALLGELIALGLGRGNELADLTLNVANVVVEPDDEDGSIPEGEFVAITVRGAVRGTTTRGDRGASPRPKPCARSDPQPGLRVFAEPRRRGLGHRVPPSPPRAHVTRSIRYT